MKKILMSVLILFCLLSCLSGAEERADLGREAKVDSVLASVNGDPVTLLDVILESGRDEARLAAMFTGERLYSETAKIRKLVVDDIVIRKLVYAKYKEKPFDIKKQHIEDMVDYLASGMGDGTRQSFVRRIKGMGGSLEELREKAKEKIAVDVLFMDNCDRRVSVTPRDVFQEYKRTPEKWKIPATLELQLLLIRSEKANYKEAVENMKKMLKDANEHTFTLLTKENSEGPAAAIGGFVGKIEQDKLRPEFASVLKDLHPGEIVGPVETPEGSYFIRVHALTESKSLPFEQVAPTISETLKKEAQEKNRAEYKAQLLKEAVVRYFF